MKKKMLIGLLIVLVLILGGVAILWYWVGKPLYEPGMVRAGRNLRSSLDAPAQSPDADFWTVEPDIKLHHYSVGTGQSILVVHGGPGYPIAKPWGGLAGLTERYRFIFFDQRGCGKSTRPVDRFPPQNYFQNLTTLEKTLGLGAQIADIERIRRILGQERLILFGHSFGALLASLYAAEFPEKVQALVLVAPASVLVMPAEDGGLFEVIGNRLPEEKKRQYDDFLKAYLDFGGIFAKSEAELAKMNREIAEYYVAALGNQGTAMPRADELEGNGGWMVQAIYFSMGRRHDYRAALKSVNAPVLVIHGERDLQPEKASRIYAEAFPNSRFHLIRNAGHFCFDDQPQLFASAVSKFLAGIP
mgnify:CR=1 FL=1